MSLTKFILTFLLAILISQVAIGQKYGYVNSTELIQGLPEVQEANANLAVFRSELESKGEEMFKEYREKALELQRQQQAGEIAPRQYEERAAALRQEEETLREFEEDSQEQLFKKSEELLQPIQDKIRAAIKAIAEEQGYDYIFDNSGGIILYAEETTNLNDLLKSKI
jgi:outer membrane protein